MGSYAQYSASYSYMTGGGRSPAPIAFAYVASRYQSNTQRGPEFVYSGSQNGPIDLAHFYGVAAVSSTVAAMTQSPAIGEGAGIAAAYITELVEIVIPGAQSSVFSSEDMPTGYSAAHYGAYGGQPDPEHVNQYLDIRPPTSYPDYSNLPPNPGVIPGNQFLSSNLRNYGGGFTRINWYQSDQYKKQSEECSCSFEGKPPS